MSRSAGQPRDEHTDTRGGVWSVASWTWPTRARVLLAVVVFIAAVALRVATDSLGTGLQRTCRVVPVLVIDPNTAPAFVLEALPHVGPSLVKQLIEQREIRPFGSTEDLRRRVRGLGPVTLARLAPHLRIAARSDSSANSDVLKNPSAPGPARLAEGPRPPVRSRKLRHDSGIAVVATPVHVQVEHSIRGVGVDDPGQVTVDLGQVAVGRVDHIANP